MQALADVPSLIGVSRTAVSNNVRICCAVSLEAIARLLDGAWAFAIANDTSTHLGVSYLDNRVRFFKGGKLYNFHVLAIPIDGPHTAAAMFELLQKVPKQEFNITFFFI